MRRWDDIPRKVFDAWMNNFAHERFGGRESTQQVIDRVADALDAQRFDAQREVIWITHAGVIRAVQYIAARGRQQISI